MHPNHRRWLEAQQFDPGTISPQIAAKVRDEQHSMAYSIESRFRQVS